MLFTEASMKRFLNDLAIAILASFAVLLFSTTYLAIFSQVSGNDPNHTSWLLWVIGAGGILPLFATAPRKLAGNAI